MTIYRVESESFLQIDNLFYYQQIGKVIDHIQPQFEFKIRKLVFLHSAFASLVSFECMAALVFFPVMASSLMLSIIFASILMTIFTWAALRVYLQPKREEWALKAKERFAKSCKNLIGYEEENPEHLFVLANAYCKFSARLEGREYTLYPLPRQLSFLDPAMETFSCYWHFEDILFLREELLKASIEEHIKLVRSDPTNLEIHTALANAYVLLSGLYVDPGRADACSTDRWIPPQRYSQELSVKFRATAERVIEEFKILNDYAPGDPWIHAQLAYSYHDLKMPEEEIREYEILLELCPDDRDVLYKLGVLYFQQGLNAKGLQVYEELKRTHYKKAEALLHYYGRSHTLL